MGLIKKIYFQHFYYYIFFSPRFQPHADEVPLAFAYTAYAQGRLCSTQPLSLFVSSKLIQ